MEEDGGKQAQQPHPTSSETLISETNLDPPSSCPETTLDPTPDDRPDSKPQLNQTELLRALEVMERDSLAIADSFTSLFSSLRLALSEVCVAFVSISHSAQIAIFMKTKICDVIVKVTSNSVDHMHCFGDAAGRLQESGICFWKFMIYGY